MDLALLTCATPCVVRTEDDLATFPTCADAIDQREGWVSAVLLTECRSPYDLEFVLAAPGFYYPDVVVFVEVVGQ